jgi:heme-degrading monooxygenase HmoA
MAYLIVRHDVEDYAKWKPVYDADAGNRRNHGSKGARVLRSEAKPNETIVITEWDSLEQAHSFAASPELLAAMEKAGVAGPPDLFFVNEVEHTPA